LLGKYKKVSIKKGIGGKSMMKKTMVFFALAVLPVAAQVSSGPTASFTVSDSAAAAPASISFTDKSSGTFTKRIWNFGDGSQDSLVQNPVHVYAVANTYTVRLIVSGPAGADTAMKQIFIYSQPSNPICIAGTYLSSLKVQITFTSYSTITPPSPFLTADSVGLWYKAGALPSAPSQSTLIKWYAPGVLLSRGSQYVDTLMLPALSGSDSVYGIMNGILWSDKTITTFMAVNGTLVLMRDTMSILNNLLISGAYLPDDTVRVNLDNIQTIDTSRVDTVGIWCSLVNGMADFTDKNSTRWISAKEVVMTGGRFSLNIVNPIFNNVQKTFYTSVVCIGKNDRRSPLKSASFLVGKPRPINPIRLTAKTISSTRIMLSWNNIASTGVERVIIWYRPFQPVPLVYDVSTLGLDSLVPSVADTAIAAGKLLEKVRYYFGAQVYKDGLWSNITDSASATDSTPPACCGNGIIRRAAPVAPFFRLIKSDRGYLISFGGYNREEVSAAICSVKGQSIIELKAGDFGRNAMLWNYRDKYGRPVINGVYLLRIIVSGQVIRAKILVQR
jgi:hypothetical protein